MEETLQHETTTQCLGLPPTGPGNHRPDGTQANNALTFKLDHSSGADHVHATLAGVLSALAIPLKRKDGDKALLHHMEHALHPWVAYMILPIFAFANAGVSLTGVSLSDLAQPLPLGIAAGLFIGKQIGVLSATWLAVKTGLARLPDGVGWRHIYGVACLTGVGFTMSLFIGSLAFGADETMNAVRLGVICGSVVSGLLGYMVLRAASKEPIKHTVNAQA